MKKPCGDCLAICLLTKALRTVVNCEQILFGEGKFDKGGVEANISQELLQYLEQQYLLTSPVIPEMQRLQNNMKKLLYRTDLGEYDKARQYMQL